MKKVFFVILILSFVSNICAQNKTNTIEEYKNRIQQNFDSYNSSVNKKYSDYLKGIWKRYKAYSPFTVPDEDINPVIYEEKDSITIKEVPIDENNLLTIDNENNQTPSPHTLDINKENMDDDKLLSVSFYKTTIQVRYIDLDFVLNNNSNQSIADIWDKFCEVSQFNHTLYDCLNIKENYNLCDWAYLQLIHQISGTIYNDANKAILLSAFLLEQSGYDIKIGRRHDELYLLFASEYEIYNHCYYVIDDIKYYPYTINNDLDEMEICEAPRISRAPISLYIDKEQSFNTNQLLNRNIALNSSSEVNVAVNQNLLDFYSSYPTSRINGNDMTRWAMYAQTPLNAATREELYKQLASFVVGKNELEAANIILNFVQTGFTYKYDEEVWGEDRAFFAEESLAYPYCDCEDRSILFSHIIRDILELEVALVYSPGHLFTAVKFSDNVEGSYISINNEKYVICEPTCTNGAPVGWSAIEKGCDNIKTILLSKINYDKSYKVTLNTSNYKRSLFPICINGKYGYKNIEEEIVVPCEYDNLIDSKHGDKFLYGAIKHDKLSLFDYSGREAIRNAEGYIPLELNHLKDGMKGDFFAIIKFDGEWYYVNLVWGPLEADFCFNEYDMKDVSYDKNIYCKPQGEEMEFTDKFIILKKKSNNKYGVLNLTSMTCTIPFEYENITFMDNDKSKVKVYNSNVDEYKIVPLE